MYEVIFRATPPRRLLLQQYEFQAEKLRPPEGTPDGLWDLLCHCVCYTLIPSASLPWTLLNLIIPTHKAASDPAKRPTFVEVLDRLKEIDARVPGKPEQTLVSTVCFLYIIPPFPNSESRTLPSLPKGSRRPHPVPASTPPPAQPYPIATPNPSSGQQEKGTEKEKDTETTNGDTVPTSPPKMPDLKPMKVPQRVSGIDVSNCVLF